MTILGHFHSFGLFFAVFVAIINEVDIKTKHFCTKPYLYSNKIVIDKIEVFLIPLVTNGALKICYLGPFSQFILLCFCSFCCIITKGDIKKEAFLHYIFPIL